MKMREQTNYMYVRYFKIPQATQLFNALLINRYDVEIKKNNRSPAKLIMNLQQQTAELLDPFTEFKLSQIFNKKKKITNYFQGQYYLFPHQIITSIYFLYLANLN